MMLEQFECGYRADELDLWYLFKVADNKRLIERSEEYKKSINAYEVWIEFRERSLLVEKNNIVIAFLKENLDNDKKILERQRKELSAILDEYRKRKIHKIK